MKRFEPNLRIPGPAALPPSVREAGLAVAMDALEASAVESGMNVAPGSAVAAAQQAPHAPHTAETIA